MPCGAARGPGDGPGVLGHEAGGHGPNRRGHLHHGRRGGGPPHRAQGRRGVQRSQHRRRQGRQGERARLPAQRRLGGRPAADPAQQWPRLRRGGRHPAGGRRAAAQQRGQRARGGARQAAGTGPARDHHHQAQLRERQRTRHRAVVLDEPARPDAGRPAHQLADRHRPAQQPRDGHQDGAGAGLDDAADRDHRQARGRGRGSAARPGYRVERRTGHPRVLGRHRRPGQPGPEDPPGRRRAPQR